jgi:HAE1 family hydrophobic/amphiphilic exporter-1
MTLADLSIKNPVFAWMLMAFLVVFGGICFVDLGISQMPDVDFPQVRVELTLEGASPEIMESDVIDPIEDELMSVEGIREITGTARHSRANVTIEFHLNKDIDVAVQEVQAKIAQAGNRLPRELDPPIVSKQNADDQTIMWVALSGHTGLQHLVMYAKDELRDKLQTVPGVGEIVMGGYLERNMRIWLKLEELESRELSVDDVIAALQREHVEVPAGRIESGTREMNIRAVGEAPSAAEFGKIVVAYRNEAPVLLGQIAVVEDGLSDRRRLARTLGIPAVGLGVKKQHGSNAVAVARGVRKKVDELQKELPTGVMLEVNSDSTVFIEESIQEIQFTLVLSVVLTSLVCWLFLGSWSSTFNILLSIPTSIVGSFIFLYFMGFTLNTFTLLGLSLAVGIVVDDAIMVLENIVRHREKGETRVRAASRGAREITMAAVAATLAIVAIFLPIAFVKGIIGKFLYQFGVTISVAVALSLLEALTLTPMRCAQMLSVGERTSAFGRFLDRFFRGLGSGYRRLLAPCLRWSPLVLLAAVGVFAYSLLLARAIPQEIVPKQDQSMLIVRLQTPTGSSLDYTDARLRDCERFLEEQREAGLVNRYFSMVGGFGGGEVDTGIIFMTLLPPAERPKNPKTEKPWTQQDFENVLRARFNRIPGLKGAYVSDLSMRGLTGRGTQFPIQFAVTGPDWEKLGGFAEEMMRRLGQGGLMQDLNSDYQVGMPELRILPDRKRAADLGVSALSIGNTVNALVGGVRVAKFKEGGHRYDVRVRLLSEQRSRPDDVRRLSVRNREGKLVRLSEVVQIFEQATVQTITRRDRKRAITVSANMVQGKSQKDAWEQVQAVAKELLPAGYAIEITGSSALFKDTGWAFLVSIGLGVLIAYMVLASQFNSFIQPGHVLLAMPFSITGAILGLLLIGASLNMYSMIGIVLLMGIVKKNSILLVEFTNQMRERGLGVREALLEACPIRLRPILMTSISTVAAALPPALALGPGVETRMPMAVVVIGGVVLSTFLTLFVVPCAYSLLPGRVRQPEKEEPDEVSAFEPPAALPASKPGP